ncbi:uncharacterized protein LOC125500774 [Athalia rosae]|uniref:uncharacterized protein LOC125500774 n=1 Tax=Athalia rosae TaxID=37344 RepID=UPI00203350FD|nr:uncharacterized protein LOC125500774 [Athalia rosae]
MNAKLLKALCLFVSMISDRVTSSPRISYLHNHTLRKDEGNKWDMVGKFFADFNEAYLKKYEPRQITITGVPKHENIQKALKPFLKSYPHIICTETRDCGYSKIFSDGNFVIIFLDDLTEETFMKNSRIISRCEKCKLLFLCDGKIQNNGVRLMFALATKQNVPYSELAYLNADGIGLYSEFLGINCTMEARLVEIWRPGTDLDRINQWAYKFHDLNGCPVTVSSLNFTPKMMIEEYKNGTVKIVGGREGKLMLEAAEKFNFSLTLKYPTMTDRLRYSQRAAIMKDVASGVAEIGIGRLRPSDHFRDRVSMSVAYDNDCLTWGVPRFVNRANDVIFVEFSGMVWAMITLIFGVACVAGYLHRYFTSLKAGNRKNLGLIPIVFEVFALHLGNPVISVTSSPGGRSFLIASLYYAMVITTAYKTSLASILATEIDTATIVDAEGIIKSNLSVIGSLYDWNILKDQANESEITSKLLERFTINNNDMKTWNNFLSDNNYAFLARRSWLSYQRQKIVKAHESVTFDVFDTCVLTYHTVINYQKKSILRKPIDRLIQRLTESGILKHWDINDEIDADVALARKSYLDYVNHRAAHKFRNIFVLYFICITLSLVAFVLELLCAKVQSKIRPNDDI